MTENTFTLEDLTEEFFGKLCYAELLYPTGFCEPYILMVTEDGWEYLLGSEGYDPRNPQNTVPLLEASETWSVEKHRTVYRAEDNGWTYVRDDFTDILIRDDVYEKINQLHQNLYQRELPQDPFIKYCECLSLLRRLLNPNDDLRRKTYTKTLMVQEKLEQRRRNAEKQREQTVLTAKEEFKPEKSECPPVEKDLTFRELRGYLSRLDRLSICMLETGMYYNYCRLEDVPHIYDSDYVYGIGAIESEFYQVGEQAWEYAASGKPHQCVYLYCMEIVLSKEPKSVWLKREEESESSL